LLGRELLAPKRHKASDSGFGSGTRIDEPRIDQGRNVELAPKVRDARGPSGAYSLGDLQGSSKAGDLATIGTVMRGKVTQGILIADQAAQGS
jgi:hypothetical protein